MFHKIGGKSQPRERGLKRHRNDSRTGIAGARQTDHHSAADGFLARAKWDFGLSMSFNMPSACCAMRAAKTRSSRHT
jgi:hypothetical protein